ncbi:MAG: hypothetical protein FWH33_09515 [Oscillospiraceae bacterium]|nr:hypothetical protein [Oscillospiraceae bacterium]
MGLLLLALAVVSTIATVIYVAKKKRTSKKPIVVLLLLILVLSCCGLIWYLVPIVPMLPENPAIKVMYGEETDIWIENQDNLATMVKLLATQKIQRELFHNNGMLPDGILVQRDEYFIIEIYDKDKIEYSMPEHIGDYCFVISSPTGSRFILPSNNNRNKLKVLHAEDIIDELYALVTSAS